MVGRKNCLGILKLSLCAGCATNPQGEQDGLFSAPNVPTPGQDAGAGLLALPMDSGVKLPGKLGMDMGEPSLKVYVKSDDKVESMSLETYLEGVLAGEMKNDWPLEALKAQAILARTFVLKFLAEKESKYPGADISTDIEEAQAYDASGINERIRRAVKETKGVVLSSQGELPFGWFHAHSGGITAKAKEGLEYEKDEPPYTKVVSSNESDQAPEDVARWKATFSPAEVMEAAGKLGASGNSLSSIKIGERGESGRATTLIVNGVSIPAASFRIAIGSIRLKSTLLEGVVAEDGSVTFEGKGYGHGVGMSQWGAYAMAAQGKAAEEIVAYYFNDVKVARLW